MADETPRRGRPRQGERVTVRLRAEAIAALDRQAERAGTSRAQVIRDLVDQATRSAEDDGVDRAQIRRMLRLSPAERLTHMLEVVDGLAPLRGAAVGR
jgi:hypothetical protein